MSTGSITLGAATGGGVVNFTGTSGARILSGVANGVANTDAVNIGQLQSALSGVSSAASASVAALATTVASNSTSIGAINTQLANGTVGLVQQTGGSPTGPITVAAATGGTNVNFTGTSGARVLNGVAAGVTGTDAVDVNQLQAALSSISNTGTANGVQYNDVSHSSITLGGAGATNPVAVTNVAAGQVNATSTDAVNGSELYATNNNVAALQNGAAGAFQVSQSSSMVTPAATGANAVAGGSGSVATGANSTALGSKASATGANSVALGANSSDGGQSNVVSVGSPGSERRVTNVAEAVNGTDAVNLNQLVSVQQQWQVNLQQAKEQANAGVALALAASGLNYDPKPGSTSIAGAASYYGAHSGLAFGINHTSENGAWRYHVAGTFAAPSNGADVGVVGGVSYTFGR